MINTSKTGMRRSMAMLATITLAMMLAGSAQAADAFKSAQFQRQNIGHVPVRSNAKKTVYHYVAKTLKRVRRQGKVNASGIVWNCKGKRCTVSGPWPKPSVTACQKLASLVGPIRSYGRKGHHLSANYMRQCNRRFVRHNQKQKRAVRTASYTNANLAKRNVVSGLSNREKQRARMFFAKLPVDPVIKAKLSRGKDVRYLVVTNALSGRSHRLERRTWTGKILLPDLRKRGKVKPIHFTRKMRNGVQSRKRTAWLIENPDGSLSKQILNSRGRLAGNITFTRDGSVRIGIDLNGDQVADLYETTISSGEHTILASPAGQAAWEHFNNGGKNPLCNPGAPGASSAGGSFAMGMISSGDKTAMQVVCGRRNHKPGNGGSAAGGGGGISGDPGGRATDAMCKGVLNRHQGGRPGNPGMVMVNPAQGGNGVDTGDSQGYVRPHVDTGGPDVVGILIDLLPLDPVTSTAIVLYRDRDKSWQETVVDVGVGLLGPLGAFVDASAASTAGAGESPPPTSSAHPNNASDPGPDQQHDPDAAMLTFCQARAKGKAWWDSITKDTRYVHQLCENPASQPNPAGKAGSAGRTSSATLGGSYGSSVTLTTYCGQHGGNRGVPSPSDRLAGQTGSGSNCGWKESPGADGKCHGVGTQFNGGSAGSVNVTYGAVIGFVPFNPAIDPDPR